MPAPCHGVVCKTGIFEKVLQDPVETELNDMDQLIFEQTERMNEFFSPILAVLENALREIVQFVYPAIAENVDYTSLTPAFCALLVLAVFLILLRILFALFRHRSRSVYVVGCLLALFVFLPGSINICQKVSTRKQ